MNLVIATNLTFSTDVCQSNGNLLLSGRTDGAINIFDKRESKIVKTFGGHTKTINSMRWNPSGDMIAIAFRGNTTKLLDFKTGRVLYTGTISDGSKSLLTNVN